MTDLTIIQRNDWNARRPSGILTRREPESIDTVVFHWPGTNPASWKHINTRGKERAAIRGLQDFHMNTRGWFDLGYSHVIVPNFGRSEQTPNVYVGRGAQYTPAAQANHNTGTLACLILMGPDDFLSEDIKRRMRSYIRWAEDYTSNNLRIEPHSTFTQTECPGDKLRNYVNSL